MEYLATTDLNVVNQGHAPTFATRARQEVLDATFATSGTVNLIYQWKVTKGDYFSDHKLITFRVVCRTPKVYIRNRRKTNFTKFVELSVPKLQEIPKGNITEV